jgi:hypothetical protein
MGVIYEKDNIIPTEKDYDIVKYVPDGFVLYRLDSPSSVYYPRQFVGVRNGIKVNSPDSQWVLESVFDYAMKVYGRKTDQMVPSELDQDGEEGSILTHKDFIEGAKRVLKRFDYTPTLQDYKDLIFYSAYFILGKISNYSFMDIYEILNHINPIDDEFFSETNITADDIEFLEILEPFSGLIKEFFKSNGVKNIPFGEIEEEILYELENTLILNKKNLEFLKKLDVPDQVFDVLAPVLFALRKAYKAGKYSDALSFISEIVEEISSGLEDRHYYEEEEEELDIEKIVGTFERMLKNNDISSAINPEFIEELYKYLLREGLIEDKKEFVESLVKSFLLSVAGKQSEGYLISKANSAYEYFSALKYTSPKKTNSKDSENKSTESKIASESPQTRLLLKAIELAKKELKRKYGEWYDEENADSSQDDSRKRLNSIEDLVGYLRDKFHEGSFSLAVDGETISLDESSVLHALMLFPGLFRELVPSNSPSYEEPIKEFFAEVEKEKNRDKFYERYSNFVKLGLFAGHKLFLNDQDAYETTVLKLTELLRKSKTSSELLQAIGAFKSAFLSSFIYREGSVSYNDRKISMENWRFYLETRLEDIIVSTIKKLGDYFIDQMIYREMTDIWGNLNRETIKKRREAFKAYLLSSSSSPHYGKYLEYERPGSSKLVDRFSEARRRLIEEFEGINEDFQKGLFEIINSLGEVKASRYGVKAPTTQELKALLTSMVDNLALIKNRIFKNLEQLENPFYIQDELDNFRRLISNFMIAIKDIGLNENDKNKELLKGFFINFVKKYDALLYYYFSLVSGSKAHSSKTLSSSFDHMNYAARVIYVHSQVLKGPIGKFFKVRRNYASEVEAHNLKAIEKLFLSTLSPFYVPVFNSSSYTEHYGQALPIEEVWKDEKETSTFLASLIPFFFHDFSQIYFNPFSSSLYDVEDISLEPDSTILEEENFNVKPSHSREDDFVQFILEQYGLNFVIDPHMQVNFVKDTYRYGINATYVRALSTSFANEFIIRAENLIKKKYGRGIDREEFSSLYELGHAVKVLKEYEHDEDIQKLFKEIFRKTLLPVSGFYIKDKQTGIPLSFDKDNDFNGGHGDINMFSNPFLRRKSFLTVSEEFGNTVKFFKDKVDEKFYELFKLLSPQVAFKLQNDETRSMSGYYDVRSKEILPDRPFGKIVVLLPENLELSPVGDFSKVKFEFIRPNNQSFLEIIFPGETSIPRNTVGANHLQALVAHEFGHSLHHLLLNDRGKMEEFLEKRYEGKKDEAEIGKLKESVREIAREYAEKLLGLYEKIMEAFEKAPSLMGSLEIGETYEKIKQDLRKFVRGEVESVDPSQYLERSYKLYRSVMMGLKMGNESPKLKEELRTLIKELYKVGIHLDDYGLLVPDGAELPSTAIENYVIYRGFKESYHLSYDIFIGIPMRLFEMLSKT